MTLSLSKIIIGKFTKWLKNKFFCSSLHYFLYLQTQFIYFFQCKSKLYIFIIRTAHFYTSEYWAICLFFKNGMPLDRNFIPSFSEVQVEVWRGISNLALSFLFWSSCYKCGCFKTFCVSHNAIVRIPFISASWQVRLVSYIHYMAEAAELTDSSL